jgi:hypothetical protein
MRATSVLLLLATLACNGSSPTEPRPLTLAIGRWSSEAGQCLFVTASSCTLRAGCGHGEFNRPATLTNGTFEVDGTYRIEVGPVSVDPPPPAHYSGSISGAILTLTVVPSKDAQPATYILRLNGSGNCSPACL